MPFQALSNEDPRCTQGVGVTQDRLTLMCEPILRLSSRSSMVNDERKYEPQLSTDERSESRCESCKKSSITMRQCQGSPIDVTMCPICPSTQVNRAAILQRHDAENCTQLQTVSVLMRARVPPFFDDLARVYKSTVHSTLQQTQRNDGCHNRCGNQLVERG